MNLQESFAGRRMAPGVCRRNHRLAAALLLAVLADSIAAPFPWGGSPPIAMAAEAEEADGLQSEAEEARLREWHRLQFLNEHSDASGKVRGDLRQLGVQQLKKMAVTTGPVAAPIAPEGSAGAPAALSTGVSGIIGTRWIQIGPAPLTWRNSDGPFSGLVTDIAIDPRGTTDRVIYIGTDNGGVWKSTDAGTTWSPKSDFEDTLTIGAVALDPANPDVVYAGTGDYWRSMRFAVDGSSDLAALGLLRSENGGDSWKLVGGDALRGRAVNRIVVPSANVVVVATNDGLFFSHDGGDTFGNDSPDFSNNKAVRDGNITDLHLDAASPLTVLAAVDGSGIFRSSDGGKSFPDNLFTSRNGAPTADLGYIVFGQSTRPNTQTIYAAVVNGVYKLGLLEHCTTGPKAGTACRSRADCQQNSACVAGFCIGGAGAGQPCTNDASCGAFSQCSSLVGIFKSTNGGTTWARLDNDGTNSDMLRFQAKYDQVVGVDPQNPDRAYFGFGSVWVTNDGGSFFTPVGDPGFTMPGRVHIHGDVHAITLSPTTHVSTGTTTPVPLFVGTDGGIHTSSDGGDTWANINGRGGGAIATMLFYGIDIGRNSINARKHTYGGAQDIGAAFQRPDSPSRATWGETAWSIADWGDGGPFAVDPCNPLSFATSIGFGNYRWSNDGGGSLHEGTGLPSGENVFRALAFDPKCGHVYLGTDAGKLLTSTSPGGDFSHIVKDFGSYIYAIAVSPADSEVVWVGLQDGTILRTKNVLTGMPPVWTSTSVANAIPGNPVSAIAADPINSLEAIAVYPGFCGTGVSPCSAPTEHVFRTTNGGASWDDISGNLPDLPLHSVVIDPGTTPHSIIVASDAGVLRSADLGASWQVLGQGLPHTQCQTMALDSTANPPLLRVGTYGRSAFELALPGLVWVDFTCTSPTCPDASQDGTYGHPYSTLAKGLTFAPPYGTILIKNGGSSTERPTISEKPVTVLTYRGTAVVGQ